MSGTLENLRKMLQEVGQVSRPAGLISTGTAALDRLLPAGGFRRGSTVEWLSQGVAAGASLFTLMTARQALRAGGLLVVVDRQRMFYPPAAAAWGIDLAHTMLVRPVSQQDECWALDQALRCPHVAAVIGWPANMTRQQAGQTFRRWQLAAEQSGALGLFVRSSDVRCEPSWADVRLLVSPRASAAGWRLRVELLKCRGRWEKGAVELEVDDLNGTISAVPHAPASDGFSPPDVRPARRLAT